MPLRLVIFDCDGVLVDSETVVSEVVARNLSERGWPMTPAESQGHFLGMSLTDMIPLVEARIGKLPPNWLADLSQAILARLSAGVPLMPNVVSTLRATAALGLPIRVASNSSQAELAVKFRQTGLDRLIPPDRIHSAGDVIARGGRGKPAPDLFLFAAAQEGVAPQDCIVVEDSVPGTTAARLAGMTCLGLAPHGTGDTLRAQGASVIRGLAELPALFQAAMREDVLA